MSTAAFLLVIWWLGGARCEVVRNEDICGPHNGRRLYVELGEQGVLHATNVSLVKNLPRQDGGRPYTSNSSHDQCSLELVTCPSCIINLTFKSINLQHHCGDGGMTIDSPCRCDYVWVSEPPYEDVSGTPFCGHYAPITYRSNTRTLSIALLYSQSHQLAFSLEYVAERNRLLLKGSSLANEMSKSMNNTGGGILTSPFFPARYPRDLGMEYIITCPTEAPSCRVRVLFSDFQLAAVSIMEFYDWNGQRLDVSSGARFRPPIIVSSGPSLLIRFYANGGTGLGYKAFYSFVLVNLYDKHTHPITDCGGYVENPGGAITMMDMVGEGVKTYDCVWLIRPPNNFLHMKTHMYLKVITFAEMAGNTELIIKQGPTSALMPLEVLRHPVSQLQPPRLREHITPVTNGFHVSLRGSFGPNSRLAIAYAAFSYMDCFTGSDFLCQNHRCISSQLNCDGFDHCGDNSDEPATCLHDWDTVGLQERKWQQNKANYYFPKIDRYPDLKTATLVFVASSLGLIVLISALIILLYRVGARARQQRELQSRLRTISELLVLNLADGARIDEISVSDDPPVYEAPPNYDEVIKLGIEDETPRTARRKKRRTLRSASRRSRSATSSQCSCDTEPQMTLNVSENASNANCSSQTSPTTSSSGETSLPETPPPPYVTPPGTAPRRFDYPPDAALPGPSRSSPASPESSSAEAREELQHRRSILRSGGSISRSLPSSRAASGSPPVRPGASNSVDAECALGAYGPSRPASNPIQASASSGPQSTSSSAACASTRAACADSCDEAATEARPPPPAAEQDHHPDDQEDDDAAERGCSCEGACGCASTRLDDGEDDAAGSSSAGALLLRRASAEDSPDSGRSRVVRLLTESRRAATNSPDTACSSLSTGCSTPCGTFRRGAPRKLSICSRDSRATRFSTVSAYSSYERLQDDFEVVSETTSILGPGTLANTPRNTPSKLVGLSLAAGGRHYSSCDLDSLYESIRVLDSFLAQRGGRERQQSVARSRPVALMLFGTPRHKAASAVSINADETSDGSGRIRVWRSTDSSLGS